MGKKKKIVFITIAAIVILSIPALIIWFSCPVPTVESVMNDFYGGGERCEGELMDPLINNAELVKTRVIQDIQNPKMEKRRYAIGCLGNERITEAMPVLLTILKNELEIDYFRSDALESIYRIDSFKGRELAREYSKRNDFLGRIAKEILDGTYEPYVRSKKDARSGKSACDAE